MPTFKTVEDIDVWQKARALTREIYEVSNVRGFAKDFGLRDQIRRASVSIMSNTARMINGLMSYLRGSAIKGMKYRAEKKPQT